MNLTAVCLALLIHFFSLFLLASSKLWFLVMGTLSIRLLLWFAR